MSHDPRRSAAVLRLADGLRSLNRIVALLCGVAVLAAVVLILIEIVGRQFPAVRLGGADEISGYVMAGIATWGFAFALTERAHVRIDILHLKLPAGGRALLDVVALASVAVVAAIVAWYAYDVLAKSITRGSRSNTPLGIQLWIPQAIWFAGWVWLTLTSFVLLAATLLMLARRDFAGVDTLAGTNAETGEVA